MPTSVNYDGCGAPRELEKSPIPHPLTTTDVGHRHGISDGSKRLEPSISFSSRWISQLLWRRGCRVRGLRRSAFRRWVRVCRSIFRTGVRPGGWPNLPTTQALGARSFPVLGKGRLTTNLVLSGNSARSLGRRSHCQETDVTNSPQNIL